MVKIAKYDISKEKYQKKLVKNKSSHSMTVSNGITMSNLFSYSSPYNREASVGRRKILITGCSSGIGYYCADQLRKDGHIVVASCRKDKDVDNLISEGFHAVKIDLDNSDSIVNGIRDALTITNGELDVLINNAAYGQPGAVEDLSREVLEKQFSTNVFGTHELTVRLMKVLLVSKQPRIIQISSVLGLIALRYRGAYISSKFALEGLTDAMRLEFSDTNIKVSLIEPGPILSNFRKNAQSAFTNNIIVNKSRHIDRYKRAINRFGSTKKQPFTLSEQAVYKKVLKVIYVNNPKPRYYVTKPTYIFAFLKRILSTKMLDKILLKVSDTEDKRFD